LVALGVATAAIVAVSVLDSGLSDIWFPAVFFGWSPWLAGRILRARTMLARELEERALRLEADRDAMARRAVGDERRRIAHELHDVVAHSLSVMVVQAGAGRRLVAADPERAADCAALIERMGREAMGEMRRLLGVMGGSAAAPLAPQPGLARLDELVGRARAAGLPVELRTSGEPVDLPAGVDVAAYRIVQEALTNALQHAGPAHARVLVTYAGDALELEVVDNGRGAADEIEFSGGHGLVGMRERAAVCGGEVAAGRRREGGFQVHARFPLRKGMEAAVA
jgi:signal transduction histidine kinase